MNATLFRSLRSFSALLLGLILLAGCSSLPKTAALTPAEQQSALSRLHDFASAIPSSSVDTGYDLAWDIMGQSGKTEAQLQMEAPDMLRFSALDPLGRLLYLAVADGQNFALVDNRAATVQRGPVNGPLWRKHVPEPLAGRFHFAATSVQCCLTAVAPSCRCCKREGMASGRLTIYI